MNTPFEPVSLVNTGQVYIIEHILYEHLVQLEWSIEFWVLWTNEWVSERNNEQQANNKKPWTCLVVKMYTIELRPICNHTHCRHTLTPPSSSHYIGYHYYSKKWQLMTTNSEEGGALQWTVTSHNIVRPTWLAVLCSCWWRIIAGADTPHWIPHFRCE